MSRNFFNDTRHERSLMYLLSLGVEAIAEETGLTKCEPKIIKSLVPPKIHRQKKHKKNIALQLID